MSSDERFFSILLGLRLQQVRNLWRCMAETEYNPQLLAIEQDLLRVLLVVHAAMNDHAPVNRLPPEMLAEILERRSGERDLVAASHVCRQWRSVLISTPSLWTTFRCGNLHRTTTYLERSGSALIDVVAWDDAKEDVFPSLVPHMGRVRSLAVSTWVETIRSTLFQLHDSSPTLQVLDINFDPGPPFADLPHDFIERHAPSLRRLTLANASPPFPTFPLPSLTHFTLRSGDNPVSMESLLDVLKSSPLLQNIDLELLGQLTVGGHLGKKRVVTLVDLHKFALVTYKVDPPNMISHIIGPRLRDLHVSMHASSTTVSKDISAILPPHSYHFPLIAQPEWVGYSCTGESQTARLKTSDGSKAVIKMTLPDGARGPEFYRGWLSSGPALSLDNVKELEISWRHAWLSYQEDAPACGSESLEVLRLEGYDNSSFRMLKPYRRVPSGSLCVPFQKLKMLEIRPFGYGEHPIQSLVDILKERNSAGCRIEVFRFTGHVVCPLEVLDALEGCVGELINYGYM